MVELCIPENNMLFCFSILTFLVGKRRHKIDIKKKWLKVTENLGVDKKFLKHVQAFQTELTFGSVGFRGTEKTGVPREKPLGKTEGTNNKLNPHIGSKPGFEPRPHWWEANYLTTASPLLPCNAMQCNPK